MIVRRFGNNIPIRWVIERDGIAEDFSGLTLRLYLEEIGGTRFECEGFTTDGNVISYLWKAEDQKEPGTYSLILEEYEDGVLVNTADEREAIHLTTSTREQDGINAAAMFTTDVQGVVSSYGSLEALLAEARAKIEALSALNDNAQAQLDALTSRINYLNEMMRQAAEYQLTYGTAGKPYTDAKFAELVAQQQQQFLALQEQMRMLIASGLEGFGDSISPLSIQAMMAIFGSEALQYEFISNINGNSDGSYTVVNYRPKVRTLYSGDAVYTNGDEVIYDGYYYAHDNSNTQGTPPTDSNVWTRGAAAASEYAEVFLTETVVLHHTIDINAVSPSFDVHQYKRWAITGEVHLPMPNDNQGYYIYIKANKDSMTADADSTPDNKGATGTAEFIITTEGHEMDPGDGYYYFLYATVNALSAGKRVIATWNGFTSIKPGEIQANKFISSDGTQFTDYLAKSWRVGGTGANAPFIEWNLDYDGDGSGDGKLVMRGTIQQLPNGERAIVPSWRGDWYDDIDYYYGNVVQHKGQSWIMKDSLNEPIRGIEPTVANTQYWGVWSMKGADGQNGADGAAGRDGINGRDGRDGRDGINGRDGRDGANGLSRATVYIYRRGQQTTAPDLPTNDVTYYFSTGAMTNPNNGWEPIIPGGIGPCWVSSVNIVQTDRDDNEGLILPEDWSAPKRLTGDSGLQGKIMRGVNEYSSDGLGGANYQGLQDTDPTHEYYDVVYVRDNINHTNTYYYCKLSEGSVGGVTRYAKDCAPGTELGTAFWVEASFFNFVATNVLLANSAHIDCLSGNSIYMKDWYTDKPVAGIQGGSGADVINFFAGMPTSEGATISDSKFIVYNDGRVVAEEATVKGSIECSGNNFTDENNEQYAIKSGNGLWVEGHGRLEEVSASHIDAGSIDVQGGGNSRIYTRKTLGSGGVVSAFGYAMISTNVDDGYEGTVTLGTNNTNIANRAELKLKGADATLSRPGHAAENLLVCPTAKRIEVLSASSYAALVTKDANTLYFITD